MEEELRGHDGGIYCVDWFGTWWWIVGNYIFTFVVARYLFTCDVLIECLHVT